MTERKYQGKSIPVRVYTTRGLKDQARFALECAHRTVDYFSEIFEIEYPLPKADLLAVHEFVGCKTFPSVSSYQQPAD
jgi:aminopeptidase N